MKVELRRKKFHLLLRHNLFQFQNSFRFSPNIHFVKVSCVEARKEKMFILDVIFYFPPYEKHKLNKNAGKSAEQEVKKAAELFRVEMETQNFLCTSVLLSHEVV